MFYLYNVCSNKKSEGDWHAKLKAYNYRKNFLLDPFFRRAKIISLINF